jgi:hypothetical protein
VEALVLAIRQERQALCVSTMSPSANDRDDRLPVIYVLVEGSRG